MRGGLKRAEDGGISAVIAVCKWTCEGLMKTKVSISGRNVGVK